MQVFWNARIKAVEAVIDLYKSLHKLLIDIQSFLYMSAVEIPQAVVDIGLKIWKPWISVANVHSIVYEYMPAQIYSYIHNCAPRNSFLLLFDNGSCKKLLSDVYKHRIANRSKGKLVSHDISWNFVPT